MSHMPSVYLSQRLHFPASLLSLNCTHSAITCSCFPSSLINSVYKHTSPSFFLWLWLTLPEKLSCESPAIPFHESSAIPYCVSNVRGQKSSQYPITCFPLRCCASQNLPCIACHTAIDKMSSHSPAIYSSQVSVIFSILTFIAISHFYYLKVLMSKKKEMPLILEKKNGCTVFVESVQCTPASIERIFEQIQNLKACEWVVSHKFIFGSSKL